MKTEQAISELNVKEKIDLAAKLTQAAMSSFQHNTNDGIALEEMSNIAKNTTFMFSIILEKILDNKL